MILEVAIDTPLRQVFDYRPADGEGVPVPGTRVLVPFGRRQVIGIVVSHKERSEHSEDRLKRILRSIDPQPTLDAPLLKLLRWAADYYHHPLGEALATALPKLAREGAALLEAVEVWHLTDAGRAALAAGEPRRAPRQRAVLEALQHRTEGPERAGTPAVLGTEAALLDDTLPGWRDAARALRDRGWVERGTRGATRASPAAPSELAAPATAAPPATPRRPAPTAAQQAALEAICARDRDSYHAWLLHGVTGSGKTEVYLRLTEDALAAGRSVLVLVPEIGLTPQLVGRFAARFAGVPLAVLHSGLTDGARLAAWRRAHSGEARLVIGTRSAIFAPLPALGLMLVDEEHDAFHLQRDQFTQGGFGSAKLFAEQAHQLPTPGRRDFAPSQKGLMGSSQGVCGLCLCGLPHRCDGLSGDGRMHGQITALIVGFGHAKTGEQSVHRGGYRIL